MSATLLLWRSMRQMSGAKRLLTNPGHSSLVLSYPDPNRRGQAAVHTITWYSERNPNMRAAASHAGSVGVFKVGNIFKEMAYLGGVNPHQHDLATWIMTNRQPGNWVDMMMKNQEDQFTGNAFATLLSSRVRPPNLQAEIPTLSDPDAVVGLFDTQILAWWQDWSSKHNDYHLLYRTCAAVCGNALLVGGADAWAKTPHGVWTPESVYEYATKIRDQVLRVTQLYAAARSALTKEAANLRTNIGDVWTVEQWYAASEANVGFLSRRYQALKDVDAALGLYHGYRTHPGIPEDFRRQLELNALAWIVLKLHKILQDRPESKRKAAVAQLGKQALDRTRWLKLDQQMAIDRGQHQHQVMDTIETKMTERLALAMQLQDLDQSPLRSSPQAAVAAQALQARIDTLFAEQHALEMQLA